MGYDPALAMPPGMDVELPWIIRETQTETEELYESEKKLLGFK